MSVNWRDAKKEKPPKGKLVWALYQHGKEHRYRSTQMMCGEVEYGDEDDIWCVNSDDFTGNGCWSVHGPQPYSFRLDDCIAWCFIEDLQMPDFIPHNKHWGNPI